MRNEGYGEWIPHLQVYRHSSDPVQHFFFEVPSLKNIIKRSPSLLSVIYLDTSAKVFAFKQQWSECLDHVNEIQGGETNGTNTICPDTQFDDAAR